MGNRLSLIAPLAAWALFAACALWLTRADLSPGQLQLDTDSAMRLAQVRDLMAGQGWFDLTQHRLNTPLGLPMHWSRLVDAPLALLMLVSERFALTAWPLLLFGALLFLLARLARALGGRPAMVPALLLALLCTELFAVFAPGNIDHHGLQLVLMLAALLGVVEKRPMLTAAAVALSLAVGLETLPYALVAILFSMAGEGTRRFGGTLAGMALVLLAIGPNRGRVLCDSYSLFHAALLAAGGLGIAALTFLPRYRLAGVALLAIALAGLAALINPVCFAGPYAGVDPRMASLFFARINEAHPVWDFFRLAPSQVVGGYLYAAFALLFCFAAPPGRARLAVMVFAATALAVATLQFRATPFALVFALAGLAAGLTQITARRGIVWLAVMLLLANGATFTLAGALAEGQDHVADRVTAFRAQEACGQEPAMAALKALPPGRVAGFVDQGPAVLAYTQHSAIAGPYHRNASGILDSYEIFAGQNPRAVLDRRGIDYLMTCRAAPDWDFYRGRGGLVAQLAHGRIPDWLAPVGVSGAVQVYRIRR
jgi:MFS family permease